MSDAWYAQRDPDIVERLRKADLYYCENGLDGVEYCTSDLPDDAADEIERLKAELRIATRLLVSADAEIERLVATWKAMWEAGDGHGEIEAAPTKDQG